MTRAFRGSIEEDELVEKNLSTEQIAERESGGPDAFDLAASSEPPPIKSKYVSTSTVAVGEGVRFRFTKIDKVVPFGQSNADETEKLLEVSGEIVENRAKGLIDGGTLTITCSALRLRQMGTELLGALPDSIVTLVRGEDEGKSAGWRWRIERPHGD